MRLVAGELDLREPDSVTVISISPVSAQERCLSRIRIPDLRMSARRLRSDPRLSPIGYLKTQNLRRP
jgi:hypothetical protein